MKGKRKQHKAAFEAQVALAALKGDRTINELAAYFAVHPTNIHTWRKQLLAGAESVFTNNTQAAATDSAATQTELYEQIGRLQMELAWVKKKLPPSAERLRPLIEADHPDLSVPRQCQLLSLNRSSLYYQPAGETPQNLRLMRLIDEQYTAHPFYGSRKMTTWLQEVQQEPINRKRVRRLMRQMGLEAIYPKPRLSLAGRGHRVFP